MTISLELSADQEQRLEDGKARRDAAAVRAVLLQAVDSTVQVLLESRSAQPSLAEFTVLLDQLEADGVDLPALSDEAISRSGIYGDHP